MKRVTIHRPRILPATIAVMALLMVVKSVGLVVAAMGGGKVETGGTIVSQAFAAPAETHGSEGAPASAALASVPANAGPAKAAGAPAETGMGAQSNAAPPPPVSEAERALLLDLRHRSTSLDERARDLDQRNAVLGAAENKLTARVGELGALQARLEQLEAERRAHDDANWSGLVHVYETMKPRDAAQIFDSLDMQVLLGVLDRMQPRRVAPILAAMSPDRARLATQMLAEMRTHAVTLPASAAAGLVAPKG